MLKSCVKVRTFAILTPRSVALDHGRRGSARVSSLQPIENIKVA